MRALFRVLGVAAVLGPLGCSSTGEAESGVEVPGFAGNVPGTQAPADTAGSAGATSAPPGDMNAPSPGASAGAPSAPPSAAAGAGSEAPPSNPPLVGGEDMGAAGSANVGSGAAGAGGAGGDEALPPAGEAGAAGSGGALPIAPRSDLPVPPGGGVPQPSGAPGNLRVLDWAGFRAAYTYTFDDSNASQFANYGALQALDVPMSFYLQTEKDDAGQNDAIWRQILADGHELGNHTRTHQQAGGNIGADTDAATAFIQSRFGVTVYSMAAPFGAAAYIDVARSRFLFNRGTGGGLVRPNDATDPFNLPCFIPVENLNTAGFNAQVDAARNAGAWGIALVHGFSGGVQDFAFQPVAIGQFTGAVQYAKSLGDVWIDTLVEVGAYWRAQRLLAGVTPTQNGGTTTWTWTLPERFPPDRFVRVRVDGGTLTQAGAQLEWDDHGYYEVALDVGSLTLSP